MDLMPLETVVARGVPVRCLMRGQGPRNVVLMPGWGSNPWVYQCFLEAAPPDRYRVVAVDLFGESGRPWGGYNVSGFADEVRDLMDALDMRSAAVGGHSLGGVAALLFAQRFLDRLDALVLIGTGPTTKHHGTLPAMLAQLEARGKDRASIEGLVGGSYGTLPPPDVFRRYIDHAMKAPIEGLIEAMSSAFQYDFVPLLRYITAPTLIVHGRYDAGRLMYHAEALKSGIPNSRLAVFECAHYIMEELPEAFNATVLAFLAELA
ncbi:MAG: alpha/beta hydrolase [Chloroflexi bacterium]|nr:alpha/beta hydrolase [Chloroflexota bacterium]